MDFELSINKNIIDKGDPRSRGWKNVKFTTDELAKHIKSGFAFSQGVLKQAAGSGKPQTIDIEKAQLLPIDIDNELKVYSQVTKKYDKVKKRLSEGYFAFQDAIEDTWLQENALLLYTSPSHTDQHNKFRIVFLLPEIITDAAKYSQISAAFIEKYDADRSCKNIDRMFFGNTKAEVIINYRQLNLADLNKIVSSVNAEDDFKPSKKNDPITEEQAAELLKHIPTQMDYIDWGKVVSGIGNTFDEPTAIRLIDNWSPDDQKGTKYRIQHRSKRPTIASVIWLAKYHGCDITKVLEKHQSVLGIKKSNGNNGGSDNEKDGHGKESNLFNYKKKCEIDIIEEYLDNYYQLRYNIVTSHVEIMNKDTSERWQEIDDRFVDSLLTKFHKMNYKFTHNKFEYVLNSDFVRDYHPFKDYFNNLPGWDGEDYIQQYINLIEVPDEQKVLWTTYFTKWIIGVVACATERGLNHNCIVFSGSQGIGKTTIIGRLIPEQLQKYYSISQINPNDKDSKIDFCESFIINLDELESVNRDEIGHLKSLMSIDRIRVRKPYQKRSVTHPRRASFIGSVNKAMFLGDLTGNRRFLVVETNKINLSKTINVDQLYAQALSYLNDGWKYWFSGSDIDNISLSNIKYQLITPEEEIIQKLFDAPKIETNNSYDIDKIVTVNMYQYMTATEIYDAIQKETSIRLSYTKLGQILKNMGFKQVVRRFNDKIKRVYVVKKADEKQESLYKEESKF